MARKNEYDKYIISASEVGAYVLCPQAWHLSQESHSRSKNNVRIKEGEKLHQEWADKYGESVFLKRHVRLLFSLVILCVLLTLLTVQIGG